MEALLQQQRLQNNDLHRRLVEAQTSIEGLTARRPAGAANPTDGYVATRMLGKPVMFSGDMDADGRIVDGPSWGPWSFTMRAYASAIAPRMAKLMRDAETASENPLPIEPDVTSMTRTSD